MTVTLNHFRGKFKKFRKLLFHYKANPNFVSFSQNYPSANLWRPKTKRLKKTQRDWELEIKAMAAVGSKNLTRKQLIASSLCKHFSADPVSKDDTFSLLASVLFLVFE